MKKLSSLITCCIIILSGNVYSQKAKFGISAGVTLSTYKLKAESVSVTSKAKAGLTLGIFSDLPLARSWSFMPALNFVQKGGTIKSEGTKDRLTLNYLEMPLNFLYNAKVTNGRFVIGAGPSLNLGMSGKDKWTDQVGSGSDKVKFGKDKDFRRLSAGVNMLAGYVARSGMMLSVTYNATLTNSVDARNGGGKFTDRYLGCRLGFTL